tara:strand:- start:16932 stop:17105 length:174 start_codon:yes stop_codon:yes gene_type:complete
MWVPFFHGGETLRAFAPMQSFDFSESLFLYGKQLVRRDINDAYVLSPCEKDFNTRMS